MPHEAQEPEGVRDTGANGELLQEAADGGRERAGQGLAVVEGDVGLDGQRGDNPAHKAERHHLVAERKGVTSLEILLGFHASGRLDTQRAAIIHISYMNARAPATGPLGRGKGRLVTAL